MHTTILTGAKTRRAALALLSILALVGLGASAGLAKTQAPGRDDTVVVVVPGSAPQDAYAQRLAAELAREPGFAWTVTDKIRADDRSHSLAVVTLPAQDPLAGGAVGSIKIDPVRFLPADQRYFQLVQATYEGSVRASLAQIFDAVSRARVKLNAASFTTGAMDGELKDADSTVENSTAGFNNLIATSEPILVSTRSLLNGYRPSIDTLSRLADRLTALATRPVDATLGDIRSGLDMNRRAADLSSPFMPQVEDLGRQAATQLGASPSDEVRSIGEQLGVILRLAGANNELSPSGAVMSPEELSKMFDSPVSDSTTLSDFMSISASRVRGMVGTFSEASRRLDQMAAMVADAKSTFLTSKAQINERLDRFRDVVGKLNAILHTATNLLPKPSANQAINGLVELNQHEIDKFSAAERSAYIVLIGALLCALFIVSSGRARTVTTRIVYWFAAAALLGVGVAATMAAFGSFTGVLGAALTVSFVSVGLSLIVLRLAPRLGVTFGLVLVVADIALATRMYSSGGGSMSTMLPSSFIGRVLASGLQPDMYTGAELLAAVVLTAAAVGCLVGRGPVASVGAGDREAVAEGGR